MSDELAALEDEVFRALPRDFTAARDALVAALKAAKRAEEAKAAKAWRRPSAPVWLWNRMVLDGEACAEEAVAVADVLGEAISGGGSDLGPAVAALRGASSTLLARAREVAAALDLRLSLAQERELVELVHALPWSAGARQQAARGRLLEAPPPVDPLEAMRVAGGAAPSPAAPEPPASKAAAVFAAAQAALEHAEAALARATAATSGAARAHEQARAAVVRAQKLLDEAEQRARDAAAAEESCARAVAEARQRRDAAKIPDA